MYTPINTYISLSLYIYIYIYVYIYIYIYIYILICNLHPLIRTPPNKKPPLGGNK